MDRISLQALDDEYCNNSYNAACLRQNYVVSAVVVGDNVALVRKILD